MKISFSDSLAKESGALAVLVTEGSKLGAGAANYNEKTGRALEKAFKSSRFNGKAGEVVEVLSPANVGFSRIVALGLGKPENITAISAENAGAGLAAKLLRSGETSVSILVDTVDGSPLSSGDLAVSIATGLKLRAWHFSEYLTKVPETKKPSLASATVISGGKGAAARFDEVDKVLEGVFLTRTLITEPANVINPASFAKQIKALEKDGLKVTILKEKDLEKIGMRALLAVGQGSDNESHVAIMEWNGGKKGDAPVAFVGKGVTFDTGGISLKPGAGMEEMKWDMGGAGIVTGAMKALARRKAKANVIGIVGLVENMPSGRAQRPGDVVKSLSGQTIEVINTDAEGRLVLADVLWYCQDQYKPKVMIDLATLTGAMIITLGRGQYAGFFTPNDDVADGLTKAGNASGDLVWRLPLSAEYDKIINCEIADMRNSCGKEAGSITAAQFLKRFTNDVPWAHIDVAGTVFTLKPGRVWEKGATGHGVRLLDQYVRDNFEGK